MELYNTLEKLTNLFAAVMEDVETTCLRSIGAPSAPTCMAVNPTALKTQFVAFNDAAANKYTVSEKETNYFSVRTITRTLVAFCVCVQAQFAVADAALWNRPAEGRTVVLESSSQASSTGINPICLVDAGDVNGDTKDQISNYVKTSKASFQYNITAVVISETYEDLTSNGHLASLVRKIAIIAFSYVQARTLNN